MGLAPSPDPVKIFRLKIASPERISPPTWLFQTVGQHPRAKSKIGNLSFWAISTTIRHSAPVTLQHRTGKQSMVDGQVAAYTCTGPWAPTTGKLPTISRGTKQAEKPQRRCV